MSEILGTTPDMPEHEQRALLSTCLASAQRMATMQQILAEGLEKQLNEPDSDPANLVVRFYFPADTWHAVPESCNGVIARIFELDEQEIALVEPVQADAHPDDADTLVAYLRSFPVTNELSLFEARMALLDGSGAIQYWLGPHPD